MRQLTSSFPKLLFIAVIAAGFCNAATCLAQQYDRNKDKVMLHGLDFEFSGSKEGKFLSTNSRTGEQHLREAATISKPIKVNGRKIYTPVDNKPAYTTDNKTFQSWLLKNLKNDLSKLDDGDYTLNLRDIIIDTGGRIIYFAYEGIRPLTGGKPVDVAMQKEIYQSLCTAMAAANLAPAFYKRKKAIAYINDNDIWEAHFRISAHSFYDFAPKNISLKKQ